jgi:signal transduction histidine kinase
MSPDARESPRQRDRHSGTGDTVTVTWRANDGCVVLTVADRGDGIAPEDLPHVFDRFYRADNHRSRTGGGVGLGLAITKSIVEAHGGAISVASVRGAGSTFEIRLPAAANTQRVTAPGVAPPFISCIASSGPTRARPQKSNPQSG